MSEIELAPLSERLEDDEVKTLHKLLEQAGARFSGNEDQASQSIARRLSEDAMTEFLDRLEAHDLAADIYVPVEFDGRLNVGDFRIASAHALGDVLEELRDELDVDENNYEADDDGDDDGERDDDDGDDDDDDETTVIEAQLRNIWQLVSDACSRSVEKNIPLHLRV